MKTCRPSFHPARARGFTLIEILVALLILSIGLLGLAALQMSGLQANQSAYMRSQAIFLAYDMFDRIRANPDQAAKYASPSTSTANCVGVSNTCTEDVLAAWDRASWQAELAERLPGGEGSVTFKPGNTIVTIEVSWLDNFQKRATGGQQMTIQLNTEL